MAKVKAFRALRPIPAESKNVASRPYDVLSTDEARIETKGNPHSFLHITRSEIDLASGIDVYSAEVYDKAKSNLEEFIRKGILIREHTSCLYIYQLIMNGKSQTGIVTVSSIDDYDNNIILKHELTRPEKEQDRINHIRISGAQTGNVFLAYRTETSIDELVENWKKKKQPVYDFTAEDDIQHTVWVIDDDAIIKSITDIFEKKIPVTYIADGHHRAASAAKVRKELGANHKAGADYFLTTLFPSSQLQILDYNRVVKDLNGLSPEAFLDQVKKKFEVHQKNMMVKPSALHEFGLYLNHQWFQLISKPGTWNPDPIGELDITILQNNILSPVLGIHDQRTDKRIDFVGGIRGLKELEIRVDSGAMALAFSLFPVTIDQLFTVADSGNVMPPKSTWFEPKLRDGLLTHLITDDI